MVFTKQVNLSISNIKIIYTIISHLYFWDLLLKKCTTVYIPNGDGPGKYNMLPSLLSDNICSNILCQHEPPTCENCWSVLGNRNILDGKYGQFYKCFECDNTQDLY